MSCCALRWRDFLRDKESLIRPDSMPSAKITYYKPTVPGNGCSGLAQIGHEVRRHSVDPALVKKLVPVAPEQELIAQLKIKQARKVFCQGRFPAS